MVQTEARSRYLLERVIEQMNQQKLVMNVQLMDMQITLTESYFCKFHYVLGEGINK